MLNEIFFQIIPKDLEDAVDLMEAEEVFVEIVEVVAIEVECKDISLQRLRYSWLYLLVQQIPTAENLSTGWSLQIVE